MPDSNLPQVSDTLILPGGIEILPDGTRRDPASETAELVVNSKDSVALVEKMRRNLGDMPDIPRNMNPVCCVLTYTSCGLSNADIATALETTEEIVERLKASDIYVQLEKMFDERIFEDEQRTARHLISKHTATAARKMVGLVNSTSGDLALAASRDVLRIGGVDKSTQSAGLTEFKIVMIDGDDAKKTQIEIKVG